MGTSSFRYYVSRFVWNDVEQALDVQSSHYVVGMIASFFALLQYTLEENFLAFYLEVHSPNSLISNSHAYQESGESSMSFCGTLLDTVRISPLCGSSNQTILSRTQKGLSSCAYRLQI